MYLVLGITGQTGGATADALLAQGQQVRALVRDASSAAAWAARGVQVVAGQVTDVSQLSSAMDGVSGAFVLVPPVPTHPNPISWAEQVAEAVREAAQAAGLPRLVLLSSEGAHLSEGTGPIRGMHFAEQILADAAPRVSSLRPSYFLENWRALVPLAAEQGILPSLISDVHRKRGMVSVKDIGLAAATLLIDEASAGTTELAGPYDLSPTDVAEALQGALGRPVTAVAPPREVWDDTLKQAGLGDAYVQLLIEMYTGINSGHVRFSSTVPLQRGHTGVDEAAAEWAMSLNGERDEAA